VADRLAHDPLGQFDDVGSGVEIRCSHGSNCSDRPC
jgi:hypothetical protein